MTSQKKLVQYVTIQVAKRVFWHDDMGVMESRDMLSKAPAPGFNDVLVYHVSTPGAERASYNEYRLRSDAFSLQSFLTRIWSATYQLGQDTEAFRPDEQEVIPLSGAPDVVVLDRRLKASISPEFEAWLSHNNIEFEYSTGKDRRFTAKVRQCQAMPGMTVVPRDSSELATLDGIGGKPESLLSLPRFRSGYKNADEQQFFADIQGRALTSPQGPFYESLDFDPDSLELSASSSNDLVLNGCECVRIRGGWLIQEKEEEAQTDPETESLERLLEDLGVLLKAHPLRLKFYAKVIGVSVSNLKDWLSESPKRREPMPPGALDTLQRLLCAEDQSNEYGRDFWESFLNPHILYCDELSPKEFNELYNLQTGGGDRSFSREIEPMSGPKVPLRLFVTTRFGGDRTLFVVPRDSKLSQWIDQRPRKSVEPNPGYHRLCNHEGVEIVSDKKYEQLLSIARKAGLSPKDFDQAIDQFWTWTEKHKPLMEGVW